MAPPAADPPDYDSSEPNRKMEPITIQLGSFRFNGNLRMATQSTLGKYLDTARESFFSLYDVDVSNPLLPSMGVMHTAQVTIRLNSVIFAASE